MSWVREANAEPIPGYRLIEPLGSGGFGEVWKCEAPGGLFKAIKFVYGNMNSVDMDGIRAAQESRALERIKKVRHPFICSLDRFEFIEGELVIVMELADRTLHDCYEEAKSTGLIGIPRDDLLRQLRDAAEGLDFIYDKHKLVHLDVKPRNLLLVADRVKVADYGLVKDLTSNSSASLGGVTPIYAAPETFLSKVTQHSDQYSLAIVYQEMMTGHRPHVGKNIRQIAQAHLHGEPDLRALPESERPIVARALDKDPNKRFPNCMAFVAALYKARAATPFADRSSTRKGPKSLADMCEDEGPAFRDQDLNGHSTPAIHVNGNGKRHAPSNEDHQDLEVSDLGVTMMEPDQGALRPTLVIGLGGFGKKALLELRCRFLDRFGDIRKVPVLRFLYIDPDSESADLSMSGSPELALTQSEVYTLPLQPVTNYRRRSLDQISEWLPREKLYGMPRSLQPQGSRALGRLAFADNQQKLFARLRREIGEITNPDHIFTSVTNTGLALTNKTPRVFLLSAAGGGTSGLLPDLGYMVKRLLLQLRHPDAPIHAFLLCGSPQDPATPKAELANTYATLTEINHFSDPSVLFNAQYGADAQKIKDEGSPFQAVYALTMKHRSPEALNETVSHLGNYLYHEIATPLGRKLELVREQESRIDDMTRVSSLPVPLRSFGTYAVWFPRGLMLLLAARNACKKLIDDWITTEEGFVPQEGVAELQKIVQEAVHAADLQSEPLAKRIETSTRVGTATDVGDTPTEVMAGMLSRLDDQVTHATATEAPANWTKQAYHRLSEFLGGKTETEKEMNEWRKTKVARGLLSASQKLAEEVEAQITKKVFGLLDFSGARVQLAETALKHLQHYFRQMADAQTTKLMHASASTANVGKALDLAIEDCAQPQTGFRLFGGRTKHKQLRNFMDQLAQFANHRLAEELAGAVRHFYLQLCQRFNDRLRDIDFCRQRLKYLKELLDLAFSDSGDESEQMRADDYAAGKTPVTGSQHLWEVIRQSATARVILPYGEEDLEQAALRFLQELHPDYWLSLDRELSTHVLGPNGGLAGCCITSGDKVRRLAKPLLEEASKFLGQHLPIMDVAEIISGELQITDAKVQSGQTTTFQAQVKDFLSLADAMVPKKQTGGHHQYLLVPGSTAGKALGDAIGTMFPEVQIVRVPGQTDMMFLREQGGLGLGDVSAILKACKPAFEAINCAPATSPHARFDITDWLPIDP